MVITNGPGQKSFKSCFEIRQQQKASDTSWQWWINPFACLVTRLNIMLPQLLHQRTRSWKLMCWHSCTGWQLQAGLLGKTQPHICQECWASRGSPGRRSTGLFPLQCLNTDGFLCCQIHKREVLEVITFQLHSPGMLRPGSYRLAGWWRCLLCMCPAAQCSCWPALLLGLSWCLSLGHLEVRAPPGARGEERKAGTWGWGRARQAAGCSARGSFQWQKHAQSHYSTAYSRRGPYVIGQFGLQLVQQVSVSHQEVFNSIKTDIFLHFYLFQSRTTESKCKSKLAVLELVTFRRAGNEGL